MANPDWEAIESAYRAGVMSLRNIGTLHGITEGAIRKRAAKLGWVRNKKNSTQLGTQLRKNGTQKGKLRTTKSLAAPDAFKKHAVQDGQSSENTKPIRGSRHDPPVNPFPSNNQAALKHGGYARRMLLADEVIADARELTLEDELFRLRANNLIAAENIGRWSSQIEDADANKKKMLVSDISAAEKAMMRNTVRIESLEYTRASILKTFADTDYRETATEKVGLEVVSLKRKIGAPDSSVVKDEALNPTTEQATEIYRKMMG